MIGSRYFSREDYNDAARIGLRNALITSNISQSNNFKLDYEECFPKKARIKRSRKYSMSCFQERYSRIIQSKRWTAGCFKIKARNYELLEVISR